MVSSTGSSRSPVVSSTRRSMPETTLSASSLRPWVNSQRGLSGTVRRTIRMSKPSTAPSPKASRQPSEAGIRSASSRTRLSAAPPAAPNQYEPFTARLTVARHRAGTISSIAELIAAYSPPMPAPVKNRMRKNHHGANEKAVSTVASR
jgi:hypothetical protein